MSKDRLTNRSVEHAKSVVERRVKEKVDEWEKKNPQPLKDLTRHDVSEILRNDFKFLLAIVDECIKHKDFINSTAYIHPTEHSPLLRKAVDAIASRNKAWNAKRKAYMEEQRAIGQKMIDECVILNLDGSELLRRVNAF